MSRLFRPLCAVVLGFLCIGAASAASPVLDRVLESRTLRVGTSAAQPPFTVKDIDGQIIGFEADLARTLANAMEVKLELVELPFGELMDALNKGKVDIVMSGLAITPERARRATFIGPYLLSGKSILTRSATLARIGEAGEINRADLRLAALKNSTSETFVERHLPEARLTKVATYDEAIAMLRDDKIDALVADMPVCVLAMLRHPDAGFATLTEPLTVEPVGMAVSSKDSQFASLVANYVSAIEDSGMMDRMRKRWLENGDWLARLP